MGITRDGELVRSIDTVSFGDEIILKIADTSILAPNSELNVPIAFENDNLVVFNKPSGMPMHPSIKHQGDTLGNYFSACYPELTFRAVNRLDRDTSGLCVVAKNAHSANLLQGCCEKVYFAAVHGITETQGTIDAPIARYKDSIILRCVSPSGKEAVTHYKRIMCNDEYSLEKICLETGRTHQIRVHFAYIGHPLAGDDMYGGLRDKISRQALHCGELTLSEPITGDRITVKAPLPTDISALFT